MTKALCWLSVTIGFGWTAMLTMPPVVVAGITLAQGSPPVFDAKDWANLGGFGLFAGAMYMLHRQTLADFRGDLKEERAMRERQAIATNENTTVTRDMTVAMVSLTAAINQIKGR